MSGRTIGIVAGVCAAVLGVLIVVVGFSSGGSTMPAVPPPSSPLVVRTSLAPSAIFFGDPVVAQVRVDLDTSAIAPGTLRVAPSFDPFVAASRPTVAQTRRGRLETIVYTYVVQCVTDGCLPTGPTRSLKLPPVSVTAKGAARRLAVRTAWPSLLVASRLQHADTAGTPRFRAGVAVPPPRYRVSPSLLAGLLIAAAAVLCIVAVVLGALELRRIAYRRDRRRRTALELGIELVRQASRREDAGDRRKALELLAEALADEGNPGLAEEAERLAWAESPPSAEGALELADAAETAATPSVEVMS